MITSEHIPFDEHRIKRCHGVRDGVPWAAKIRLP
jgi:hypothetical protein